MVRLIPIVHSNAEAASATGCAEGIVFTLSVGQAFRRSRVDQNRSAIPIARLVISQLLREYGFHSLERAYAFPRVRLAVATLLLLFANARPASQDRARIVSDCRMVT